MSPHHSSFRGQTVGVIGLIVAIISAFAWFPVNIGAAALSSVLSVVAVFYGERIYAALTPLVIGAVLIFSSPITLATILSLALDGNPGPLLLAMLFLAAPFGAMAYQNAQRRAGHRLANDGPGIIRRQQPQPLAAYLESDSASSGRQVSRAFTYSAFLSYSHADQAWANWLHKRLEQHRFDDDLVGRPSPLGPIPKTLAPVFRDREDFTGGHLLNDATASALESSATLVVVCSKSAAQRPAVNEEVRIFRSRYSNRSVIPVIIDGNWPENFPPALRVEIASDGSLSERPATFLGADVRRSGDGKELALCKAIAGIVNVRADDIFRRVRRQKQRRTRNLLAAILVVATALTGLLFWGENNRRAAVYQRNAMDWDLGVTVEPLNEGWTVTNLRTKGAAEKAGLENGDVIVEVNGDKVDKSTTRETMIQLLGGAPDKVVALTIERHGNQKRAFHVTYEQRPLQLSQSPSALFMFAMIGAFVGVVILTILLLGFVRQPEPDRS
jgi:hypothetical protein